MSIDGSLGATSRTGTFDLRLRTRAEAALAGSRAGIAALGGLIVLSLLVCVSASRTYALLPESFQVSRPQRGLGVFGDIQLHLPAGVLLPVLALLFVSYVVAVGCSDRLSPAAVLSTIAALNAIVLLAPPLMSTDVFSYELYARMFSTYGTNPYLYGPWAIHFDLLFPWIGHNWIFTPTAYGPLFTLLSLIIDGATIGAHTCLQSGSNPSLTCVQAIAADTFAYKLTAAIACLVVVALLWHSARLRGLGQVRAVALFGLNPLVVIYGVGGGHNDLLLLAFMMLGLYSLLAHRERLGGASFALAAAVKLTGALLVPFALAAGVGLGAERRRRKILTGFAVAGTATAALGFGFFGIGQLNVLPTLAGIQAQTDTSSLPGFFSSVLRLTLIGHLVGLMLALAFLVSFALLLRRVRHGRMDWIDGAGWVTVAMLVTASSIQPWYVAWLIPLVALCTSRRLWHVGLLLTGAVQLITMMTYIPHVGP